ncbi:DUF3572 domain-containing protein [Oceanomicrobium pacificus]|uniref:DUF3572 family protein n=1 Tax=Oceanomicrobium pacificus TaxID=2692916 RepID=A0A6B0TPX7_9RHOB|nr:DUF3572 domain-containing protein [Oceanomicrobium pacificus]MXU63845.1 DUF3572 family protein [Oceanomicrobium pacificus]
MKQRNAELIAVQALLWMAGEPEMMAGFLGASGASATDLRGRAQDPEFLGFLLDYLLMDDRAVEQFCQTIDLPPDQLAQVRAALPGGEAVHWT